MFINIIIKCFYCLPFSNYARIFYTSFKCFSLAFVVIVFFNFMYHLITNALTLLNTFSFTWFNLKSNQGKNKFKQLIIFMLHLIKIAVFFVNYYYLHTLPIHLIIIFQLLNVNNNNYVFYEIILTTFYFFIYNNIK